MYEVIPQNYSKIVRKSSSGIIDEMCVMNCLFALRVFSLLFALCVLFVCVCVRAHLHGFMRLHARVLSIALCE